MTRSVAAVAFAIAAVAVAACGAEPRLDGELQVSGSSTVRPLISRAADAFAEDHPRARIRIEGPGTGDGFILMCDGRIDIATASRPIDERELALCDDNEVRLVELAVALDAVVVGTSPGGAEVDCLELGDLYALTGPESRGIDRWSGADELAEAVGGRGDLPNEPLTVVAPSSGAGTLDVYVELALADIAEERAQVAELRPDHLGAATDQLVPDVVRRTPGALGIVGYTALEAAPDAVEPLAIAAGPSGEGADAEACVAPDPAAVSSGRYPLSRTLYLYVDLDRAAERPTLRAFVDLLTSTEGNALVAEAGAISLSEDATTETRAAWTEALDAAADRR